MPLSGADVPPFVTPEDLLALLNAGAKLIRYEIATTPAIIEDWPPEQWRAWVMSHVPHINMLIPLLRASKARMVITLFTPPCGFEADGQAKIFVSRQDLQWWLADAWRELATIYANAPEIIAYEPMNEPASNDAKRVTVFYEFVLTYLRLAAPYKRVVISPPYGLAMKMNDLVPVTGPYWASAHIYDVLPFTHQGLFGYPPKRLTESIRQSVSKALGNVKSWARKNHAIVYIGEFGVTTAAAEADREKYFSDVIKKCKEYGWHWGAHAWREAACWNLETPKLEKLLKDAWR
jgi:hypothetical protein